MGEEVGGLVALAAPVSRIDAQVGEQAVGRRDRRQHPRRVALGARQLQRRVGGVHEDAGVPVVRRAHAPPLPDRFQDPGHGPFVGHPAGLAGRVEPVQRLGAGVEPLDPAGGHRVRGVEDEVGRLDAAPGLRRHLGDGPDPGAHDVQRTAVHRGSRGASASDWSRAMTSGSATGFSNGGTYRVVNGENAWSGSSASVSHRTVGGDVSSAAAS